MKKAYLSLIFICLVPFIGASIIMDNIAKKDPNAPMLMGPSLFPQATMTATTTAKV